MTTCKGIMQGNNECSKWGLTNIFAGNFAAGIPLLDSLEKKLQNLISLWHFLIAATMLATAANVVIIVLIILMLAGYFTYLTCVKWIGWVVVANF